MNQVRLNNGEKLLGTGLTVLDQKGKQIASLPEGATVVYASDNEQVAQFAQSTDNPLVGDITTEHDDIGIANITGTVTWPDGTSKTAAIEVTVINSAPDSVEFTPGSVEPE